MKNIVHGNTTGIRKLDLELLTALYEEGAVEFCPHNTAEILAALSAKYNREIALTINRTGRVLSVAVGDFKSAEAGADSRRRTLNGLRIIHTHPNGAGLSALDLSTLERGKYDAVVAVRVGENGTVAGFESAVNYSVPRIFPHASDTLSDNVLEAEAERRGLGTFAEADGGERAVVVFVGSGAVAAGSVKELKGLAEAAGAQVSGEMIQSRTSPDRVTCVGSGKLAELKQLCGECGATFVVFDNELSGVQIKALERELGLKVIDRSALILDIFAARAKSTEGKLQVELAQLKYNLPRLTGQGAGMDKMRQGIGMRGPGEKKLETDRRRIRDQITDLERRLKKMESERDLRRKNRVSGNIPSVALVGYTNAGKSTVMNALTKADVFVENMLFATLDPVTRKARDIRNGSFLLTDTVGFIDKLPHQFIEAFKSTLAEAADADLLLHVIDVSSPDLHAQYAVVMDVLAKIGAANLPMLTVYNKSDLIAEMPDLPAGADSVCVSALTGKGMEEMREAISKKLFEK